MENNKVHYDLVDVAVAPLTITEGAADFGEPVAMYGSISLDLAAQGDIIKLRADGTDYYIANANDGYEGKLNLAQVPDWFREQYLGNTISAKDAVLVENANNEPAPFALLFGFKGDKKRRRHVLYNCIANRPDLKGENKDNMKQADTESLPVRALALPDGKVKASTTDATPDSVVSAWNTAVWVADTTT